jgi:hypothetical protein
VPLLSNSIALIAVAALFGIEAWKANGGVARLVLTALAVTFALSGILLKFLADAIPRAGEIVADTFSQPAAWFVLMIAIFLVLRPFWSKPAKPTPRSVSRKTQLQNLAYQGMAIVERVKNSRETKWYYRDDAEDTVVLSRDANSLMLFFVKAGLPIPKIETNSAEKYLFGVNFYLSVLIPLMRDGHIAEAEAFSAQAATEAEKAAKSFKPENWYAQG